uniref:Uncharacterized protein n=1 Tax=Lepeophtheirus salmonis TaxID=72036 RepID=A0A0K2UEW8_LEPSM
MDSIILRDLR